MNLFRQSQLMRGALLLMESIWVYALVAFLVSGTESGKPSIVAVIAVVFGSFAISRLLQGTDLELGLLRAWGALISLLVFYVIVRADFYGDLRLWDFAWADALVNDTQSTVRANGAAVIGVPLLWAFWLRGVLRGQQNIDFEAVAGSFAIGVVVIAVVELFAGKVHAPALVGYVAVPYIAIGLLAIGVAHAARAEDETDRSFAPAWLAAAGGAVLLIALIALAFVLIDFGTAAAAIGWLGRQLGWAIGHALFYALWPFVKLMEWAAAAAHWFFVHILGGERPEQNEPPPDLGQPAEVVTKETPGWLVLLTKVLVGVPVAAFIVLGVALLFSRLKRRLLPNEVKESTYQAGRLAGDLGDLLSSLLGRLRPNLHLGGEHLDPARRLYFDLLAAGEKRGVERLPNETPLELSPRLTRTFAAETPAQITSLFEDVRYGGLPPPAPDVQRLRNELDKLGR